MKWERLHKCPIIYLASIDWKYKMPPFFAVCIPCISISLYLHICCWDIHWKFTNWTEKKNNISVLALKSHPSIISSSKIEIQVTHLHFDFFLYFWEFQWHFLVLLLLFWKTKGNDVIDVIVLWLFFSCHGLLLLAHLKKGNSE